MKEVEKDYNFLEDIDAEPNLPDENLLHAIIKSALEEKDVEYFKSFEFRRHLKMLGITNARKIFDNLPEWTR